VTSFERRLLPVADAFYFIAHDDRAGKSRLHERAVAIGLAAGLLGELVLWQRLDVRDGMVEVVNSRAPQDPLVHMVLSQLIGQPQHREVSTWLAYLAEIAPEAVVERMVLDRLLRPVTQRRLLGSRTSYVPVDSNFAAWQAVRIERQLNSHAVMAPADVFLTGLIEATGLTWHVLWDPRASVNGLTYLPRLLDGLHPPLRELVAHAEAAVGQSVLVPR
jgi:hypothetical protein